MTCVSRAITWRLFPETKVRPSELRGAVGREYVSTLVVFRRWSPFPNMRRRHKPGTSRKVFVWCHRTETANWNVSRDCFLVVTNCRAVIAWTSNFTCHTLQKSCEYVRKFMVWKMQFSSTLMGSFCFAGLQSTDGMRSMREFVFVSQFLRVFQGKFGFIRFTVEVRNRNECEVLPCLYTRPILLCLSFFRRILCPL